MESTNPFTKDLLFNHVHHTDIQLYKIIEDSNHVFKKWANLALCDRRKLNLVLAANLDKGKLKYAALISAEMGKPIKESIAEIEKCIWLCKHYSTEESIDIQSINIITEASNVFVSYEPIGVLFAIMPWNFPFWQVFRFAIPAITVGNTVILKHAPNVNGCGIAIEQLFKDSGYPSHVFSTIIIPAKRSEVVISHPYVKGITLTGSELAGKSVAALCGKYLKKCILELGGSDPFIVFEDADLELCCTAGLRSRMLNAGQVCIAAKRFIVHRSLYQHFIEFQLKKITDLVCGDPMDEKTEIGPMARPDLVDQLDNQIKQSIDLGAKLLCGGKRSKLHPQIYEPSLLIDIQPNMPVFKDETFGPVMAIMPFDTEEEALELANNSRFGLGASIWTKDLAKAKRLLSKLEAGAVF
ncbi:MAG: aldehyde dehydrogenase family protein, partial [Ignavibacteria bacterium]|nr:aldehyde dehydrogenase family protein [Ignavibacteria bacterium]